MNVPSAKLLLSFLDGDLPSAQREQIAELIRRDPQWARAFEETLRFEALLEAAHRSPSDEHRVRDRLQLRIPAHRPHGRIALLAAAGLIAAVLGAAALLVRSRNVIGEVVTGRVYVSDAPVRRVAVGRLLRTGLETAKLRLRDFSEIELGPESALVVRSLGRAAREVELLAGRADFNVERGERRFVVLTAVGRVTAFGTWFAIELRQVKTSSEAPPENRGIAMVVTVYVGSVQVEACGETRMLSAGAKHVFGETVSPSAPPARPSPPGPANRPPMNSSARESDGPAYRLSPRNVVDEQEGITVRQLNGIVVARGESFFTLQEEGHTPALTVQRIGLTQNTVIWVMRETAPKIPLPSNNLGPLLSWAPGHASDLRPGCRILALVRNNEAVQIRVFGKRDSDDDNVF